jgi:hypothetical protein
MVDLVRVLEAVSDQEEVVRLAIDEWFLGKKAPQVAHQLYTISLEGPGGNHLRIPKYADSPEQAIAAGEQWANDHPRFNKYGPWKGQVAKVEG